MATSLNSVSAAVHIPSSPVGRSVAAENTRPEPAPVSPGLASVVREVNTVAANLARDLRVELDLGTGKLGARIISDSGVVHPVPLEYVAQLAALLRQSGVEPAVLGSQVDEIV